MDHRHFGKCRASQGSRITNKGAEGRGKRMGRGQPVCDGRGMERERERERMKERETGRGGAGGGGGR
jgi:hypothetical protein